MTHANTSMWMSLPTRSATPTIQTTLNYQNTTDTVLEHTCTHTHTNIHTHTHTQAHTEEHTRRTTHVPFYGYAMLRTSISAAHPSFDCASPFEVASGFLDVTSIDFASLGCTGSSL